MKRFFQLLITTALILSVLFSLACPIYATELKTSIGTVTGASNGLFVRAKPNSAATVLASAYNGDAVVIIRSSGDWYLVNFNLYIGYVHKDYIDVRDAAIVDLGKATVDGYAVNVRTAASEDSELKSQIYQGEKFSVLGFNCGWYLVKTADCLGYIRSDLVTLLDKPTANSGTKAPAASTAKKSTTSDTGSKSTTATQAVSLGQQMVTYAKKFLGYPYVYGGQSPSGFDCSGFMYYIYKQFGYTINRGATSQMQNGYKVSKDALKPGDLVFFGYGSTATHVGMYIGNGQFIHAENSGTGVVISSLTEGYYVGRYLTARRIVD